MGSFANSLFTLMLGWLQGAVSAIWSAFTNNNGASFLNWIGRHWILIAAILCAIGMAADLCVYILRWKPFRVWRSFFSKKETENESEYAGTAKQYSAFRREEQEHLRQEEKQETVFKKYADRDHDPDLSMWEPQEEPDHDEIVQPELEPPTVTKAGYIVPADSPYRRPSDILPEEDLSTGTLEKILNSEYRDEREESVPVTQKRRRRISVSELFSDPEEELRQFDAPQHVIDSQRAYHPPVYPRGWKKNEENGE